ncbi:MAG: asparaginase [Spirochaetota bacterium]
MKKILIIHTGGTFGMIPVDSGVTLAPGNIQDQILQSVPEVGKIARIETVMPFNIDSSNITLEHWKWLAEYIVKSRQKFDGFVIIHGTDTMAYTASALSFMLLHSPKPIILTGSQRPLSKIRTDARNNLINAVELASLGIPEVCIFFGNRLFRGNRTTKVSTWWFDAFESPNFRPLAEVGFDIDLNLPSYSRRKFQPFFNLDPSVGVVKVFPGCINEYLDRMLHSSLKAIIVEGYGSGTFQVEGENFLSFINSSIEMGKLVAINTQSYHGGVFPELYQSGKRALEAGALSCQDMTMETCIVKMMYLLGKHEKDLEEAKRRYTLDIAGELSSTRHRFQDTFEV